MSFMRHRSAGVLRFGNKQKKSAIFSFLSYQFGWALVMPEIMISSRSSLRPV